MCDFLKEAYVLSPHRRVTIGSESAAKFNRETDFLFKIPALGHFGTQCLGVVGHIPLWISVLVFVLRYGFHGLWNRRPAWLRKFAAEDDLASRTGSMGTHRERPLTRWAIFLLALTISGIILGVLGVAIWRVPLYQIPIVPNVSSHAMDDGSRVDKRVI